MSNQYDYKEIETRRGLGTGRHIAVIVFGSRTIGEGKASYEVPDTRYLRFDSEEALVAWVEKRKNPNYVIIRANPFDPKK